MSTTPSAGRVRWRVTVGCGADSWGIARADCFAEGYLYPSRYYEECLLLVSSIINNIMITSMTEKCVKPVD
jgi:hypothetical protein